MHVSEANRIVYLKKKARNQGTNFPGDSEGGLCGVALGLNNMIPFYITPEKTTGVIKYLLSSTIRLNIRNEYYIIGVKGA